MWGLGGKQPQKGQSGQQAQTLLVKARRAALDAMYGLASDSADSEVRMYVCLHAPPRPNSTPKPTPPPTPPTQINTPL